MIKQKSLKRLIIANLVIVGSYQLFGPFYALFAEQLGATVKQTGFIWAVASLVTALSLLFFGRIENKLKKDKIIVYGFFGYSLGAFAFLFVNNIATLVVVLAFNAMITGFTAPAYKTLFTKLQDIGKESEEWSWLDAGSRISMSIGAALGGITLSIFGFEGIFVLIGCLQLAAAIYVKGVLKTKINIEKDAVKAIEIAKKL